MGTIAQDLRYGIRMLLGKPGFTVVAVLTLALGIGANTAIFSVVYGVILKPLPYQKPDQLVRVYSEFQGIKGMDLRRFWVSPPEFLDLQRDSRSWQSLDGWVNGGANLTGSIEPIRVTASFVTGGLLESLGVTPVAGRLLAPDDDKTGAPQVAVISAGLWKRAFGADPKVVGQDTMLNGNKCTVVGVMPQGFEFPAGEINPPEIWVPLQIDPANPGGRGSHFLYLLGRLKPGVSISQARDETALLVQHYGETAAPKTHALNPDRHPMVMYPLKDEVISNVRPALLMLMGAVVFVLLIACVNVANLLLARAEVRQREIAVRMSLGASTRRLARQFVVEGTLLALAGAAAGLALSYGALKLMIATDAGLVPRIREITLNETALLFALATCLVTGIFFGLAPLAHVVTSNLSDPLKSSAGRSTASAAAHLFRSILVVGEIALALVLLVGSGLMIRGFWKLLQVDPGFSSSNVLTMQLALPQTAYRDPQTLMSFWSRLQDRLSSIPGVQSAALVSGLPPTRRINANDTEIEGLAMGPDSPIQNVDYWQAVSPGYFETMRIRLIEGRLLDQRDGQGAQPVAVINQAMAHHFYGDQSPIGRRVRAGNQDQWRTIVGVVADVKNAGLEQAAGTELYFPYAQNPPFGFGLSNFYPLLRTSGDPMSVNAAVREAINSLDPALPISNVRTMDEVLALAEARPRFLTMLLGMFSGLALILAAVGIYGLMAYSVTQRTNEIGIRMALGAPRSQVLGLVLRHGMTLTSIGVVVGLGGAVLLTRLMSSLLFGVSTTDLSTFTAVPLTLGLVALGACLVPARRATRVDPIIALRYE
ncbi:MAG TPA: ABC transporter permease [Blastocatellia bacterium]|nr:ABC transporter permease [Blastocatellia bacterium]